MLKKALLQILLLPTLKVLSHSFIISLEGSNGVHSTGFGARLSLRGALHQNTGIIKDDEISSSQVGPCGRIFGSEIMPGFNIDLNHELDLAEANGIPSTGDDGQINMGVFVHNKDGAGPFRCQYSPDATLKSFEPMNITAQIEGVKGINPAAKDFVYHLAAGFYPNATCIGGKSRDTCVMRCRNDFGFGGCAAVKLSKSNNLNSTSSLLSNNITRPEHNSTNQPELNSTAQHELSGNITAHLNVTSKLEINGNTTTEPNATATPELNSTVIPQLQNKTTHLNFGHLTVVSGIIDLNGTSVSISNVTLPIASDDSTETHKKSDVSQAKSSIMMNETESNTNRTHSGDDSPISIQAGWLSKPDDYALKQAHQPDAHLVSLSQNSSSQAPQNTLEHDLNVKHGLKSRSILSKRNRPIRNQPKIPKLLRKRKGGLDY